MSDCLHCDINELVQKHVEGMDVASFPDVASKMAESLVDLILSAAPEEQAPLMAHAIAALGDLFLQKGGAVPGENVTH